MSTRPAPEAPGASTPLAALVVDLDGSLIRGDMLHEGLLRLVRDNPGALFSLPGWLLRGKACVKAQVAARAGFDPALLPYRAEVLTFIREERELGRQIILATASHASVARRVADHLGLFDAVLATEEFANFSGAVKLAGIRTHLGEHPFEYLGDNAADLPVWAEAVAGHFAGPRNSVRLKLEALALERPGRAFCGDEPWPKAAARALRPQQWAKNLLLLVPALLAHQAYAWSRLLLAFLAISLCASGVYVLNDLLDLESDRRHARKRHRPFASGALSILQGLVLAVSLPVAGLALSLLLPATFSAWLSIYYVLTLAYSGWLKSKAVVDVILLASLYTVRLCAGSSVAQVELSTWLLAFSMFLFLSLAFAKRFTELAGLAETPGHQLPGRGYIGSDLEIVRTCGICSGYLAVLVLALYIDSSNVQLLYPKPGRLWLLCPALLIWITRLWLLAQRRILHDDPVVFALTDLKSWLLALWCLALGTWAAIGR